MATEELAIMSEPQFGLRDINRPVLWFSVTGLFGGALQTFTGPAIETFLRETDCKSLKDLKGKPCVVSLDGVGACPVKFIRLFDEVG